MMSKIEKEKEKIVWYWDRKRPDICGIYLLLVPHIACQYVVDISSKFFQLHHSVWAYIEQHLKVP